MLKDTYLIRGKINYTKIILILHAHIKIELTEITLTIRNV